MTINHKVRVSVENPIEVKVVGKINRGIKYAKVDEATGQLVLIFNDGSIYIIPGSVRGRGIVNSFIRGDRHLCFNMTDGTVEDAGPIPMDITELAKSKLLEVLAAAVYSSSQVDNLNILREEFGLDKVIVQEFTLNGNLHNCESNIPIGTKIRAGSGLSLTLTAKDGYTMEGAEVYLHMGGENITDRCYDGGVVDIPEVTGDISLVAIAKAASEDTHFVYTSLVGMTSSTPDRVDVNDGDSYEATFTPNYGFQLDGAEVTVKMDGKDITVSTYSGGRVFIEAVTGEVHIEGVAAEQTKFSITNNLTGAKSSNTAVTIYAGNTYSATLTALTGYKLDGAKVTVTMGGLDITASAYKSGAIYISAVTGDIVITVVAVEMQYYSVTYQLSNCASTNTEEQVVAGGIYRTSIATLVGYNLSMIAVTMGGEDVTDDVVSGTTINIAGVTGDIIISAAADAVEQESYQVSVSTDNCTCQLTSGTTIPAGGSCEGFFEPASNYSMDGADVRIYMGERNITASVYDEDTASFSIPDVTGNISITAVAYAVLS